MRLTINMRRAHADIWNTIYLYFSTFFSYTCNRMLWSCHGYITWWPLDGLNPFENRVIDFLIEEVLSYSWLFPQFPKLFPPSGSSLILYTLQRIFTQTRLLDCLIAFPCADFQQGAGQCLIVKPFDPPLPQTAYVSAFKFKGMFTPLNGKSIPKDWEFLKVLMLLAALFCSAFWDGWRRSCAILTWYHQEINVILLLTWFVYS